VRRCRYSDERILDMLLSIYLRVRKVTVQRVAVISDVLLVVCAPRWVILRLQQSVGGVRNNAYTTEASCQAYCTSVPSCVAVDFNFEENACFVHTNPQDLRTVYDSTNTNQHRIYRDCTTTTGMVVSGRRQPTTGVVVDSDIQSTA